MPKLLTSRQRYLLKHPELLKELSVQKRGAFYRDVRKKAQAEIDDLTFLAQNLPERQLDRVFNQKTLSPFLESLFQREDLTNKKGRLLDLASEIISLLDHWGKRLETHKYILMGAFEFSGLKAIRMKRF